MQEPSWQDELIDRLVTDARPVRRLWRPEVRLLVWLAVVALVAIVVGERFVRSDLERKLQSPSFLIEVAAMLVAGGLLGLEALRTAVPGYRHSRVTVGTIIATLTIVALLQLRQPIHWGWTPDVFLKFGLLDLLRTAVLVVVPWVWLLVALRRGAPLASGIWACSTCCPCWLAPPFRPVWACCSFRAGGPRRPRNHRPRPSVSPFKVV